MASLAGRRRTYVSPRRRLERFVAHSWLFRLPAGPLIFGGVTLAVALTAFVAAGGTRLERTTWTEVVIILAGATLCAAAIAVPAGPRTPERVRGAWVVFAFALLAAFTAFSITWSLAPAESWLETTRALAYLAALAGGLALGRLAPGRWASLIYAIALSGGPDLRLGGADQGLPGRAGAERAVRAPATAVRLLEQRRPGGGDRAFRRCSGSPRAARAMRR